MNKRMMVGTNYQSDLGGRAPYWRRVVNGMLSAALVLALLGAVQFASLARLASPRLSGEAAEVLRTQLEGLIEQDMEELAGLLDEMLGGEAGDILPRAGGTTGGGLIRGVGSAEEAIKQGVGRLGQTLSSLVAFSLLLALIAAGLLLLVGGARVWSEAMALALLVTGLCCLVAWAVVGVSAGAALRQLAGPVAPLAEGVAGELRAFQLQVGLACLLVGGGAAAFLSRLERRPPLPRPRG